jgi:hypothetical protein
LNVRYVRANAKPDDETIKLGDSGLELELGIFLRFKKYVELKYIW